MSSEKKALIIDFDHTLAYTEHYKQDFINLAEKILDLSKKDIRNRLLDLTQEIRKGNYLLSSEDFVKRVVGDKFDEIKYEEMIKENEKLLENFSKYIPQEALDFLNKIKEKGFEIIIYTYGEKNFQKTKIKHSGILKEIEDIDVIYTQENKRDKILELIKNKGIERGYFINDNFRENEEVETFLKNQNYEAIRVINKLPPYRKDPIDSDKIIFHNFSEILEFIENQELEKEVKQEFRTK
ncbi:MAG: hypothetical protein GF335_01790 [Candidatus Moranbacteria bacterium]|nr:hypothetical protein [Candidatus Moranbacteria bacterium]